MKPILITLFLSFISFLNAADLENESFSEKWHRISQAKGSLLCVGLDPCEFGHGIGPTMPENAYKLGCCLTIIKQISPHASAVKLNRNFIKDLSRRDTQVLCEEIHNLGMLAIDDSKLTDIGSSNLEGFIQSKKEGFDAVTYVPYAGNIAEATRQAHEQNLGIIVVTLMSNPEFKDMKEARIEGRPLYQYIVEKVVAANSDAVVIGAPSEENHIQASEIDFVAQTLKAEQLVLIPGVGAQGGSSPIASLLKERCIVVVGREIIYSSDPAAVAKKYRDQFNALLT